MGVECGTFASSTKWQPSGRGSGLARDAASFVAESHTLVWGLQPLSAVTSRTVPASMPLLHSTMAGAATGGGARVVAITCPVSLFEPWRCVGRFGASIFTTLMW